MFLKNVVLTTSILYAFSHSLYAMDIDRCFPKVFDKKSGIKVNTKTLGGIPGHEIQKFGEEEKNRNPISGKVLFAKNPIFEAAELTEKEISSLRISKVWKSDCPVPIERLRVVKLSYWDFEDQQYTDGQIMVLDAVAKPVMRIFQALYNKKFPLAKVRLMDHYGGDDAKSMEDNNTSSFNYRAIIGGSKISLHSYGLAIDINPIQNPFVQFPDNEEQKAIAVYSPVKGRQYANRLQNRPEKPFRPGMAEQVVSIFKKNGFTIWGGDWDTPIDYQHFQVPRDIAERLIKLTPEEAITYFEKLSSEQQFPPRVSNKHGKFKTQKPSPSHESVFLR